MNLLKELTVPLFFSLVLALAAFALIVTECVLISRVSKKIREQDGEGVLRETGRMGWALVGICVCWTVGQLLFDYGTREDMSVAASLLGSARDLLIFVIAGVWARRVFRRRGVELLKENQPN